MCDATVNAFSKVSELIWDIAFILHTLRATGSTSTANILFNIETSGSMP